MKTSYGGIDVCFVSSSLVEALTQRGGGIEENNYHVGLELSKRHINVTIISTFYRTFKGNIKINKYFSVKEVYLPSYKNYPPASKFNVIMSFLEALLYSIFATIEIIRFKKKGLRIIIISNNITGLPLIVVSKLMRIRIIFSEGNLSPWVWIYLGKIKISSFKSFGRALNIVLGRLVCKFSDNIRAQSEAIKTGMIELGVNPAKITVISVGIDLEAFGRQDNKNAISKRGTRNFNVGFIGRLTLEKGAHLLLEIVKTASRELPSVRFFIMGDGPFREFFEELPNIDHIGLIPHDMLLDSLSKLSAVLFFQRDIGLAELEAMASGKAIIACNLGEVPKLIRHMENGILCFSNADSYISAIKILAENPALLKKISEKARKKAVKCFDWSTISNSWLSLCIKCLKVK